MVTISREPKNCKGMFRGFPLLPYLFKVGSAEVDVVCPAIKCITYTYHSNTQTMNYSHYTFVLTLKLQPQEHIDSWSDSFE